MPNERTIQAKKEIVDQIKAKLDSAVTCVVVDYKGISVEDDTKLRKQLREAGVDYFVAKNTMLRLAAKEAGYEGLNEYFEGTTAVIPYLPPRSTTTMLRMPRPTSASRLVW